MTHLDFIRRLSAGTAVCMGFGVLVGWEFGVEPLKRVVPGLVAMNPVTAVAFALSGICLWFSPSAAARSRGANLAAGLVAAVGLIKVLDLAFGHFGIDQLLYSSKLNTGTTFPNRMAPNTALNFFVLGMTLLFLDHKPKNRTAPAPWGSLFVATTSCFALLGYTYNVIALYQVPTFIPMALHTALTFLLCAVGALCARPQTGFMKLLTSLGLAGFTLRRLLAPILLSPPALGALLTYAINNEWLSAAQGLALLVLGSAALMAIFVFHTCASLERTEGARQMAERTLENQRAQIVNSAKLAALGEMAGGVAHEINNPLAIIQGKARQVRQKLGKTENISLEVFSDLEKIEATVTRISRITQGLLAFSRSDSHVPLETRSVQEIVDETLAFCSEKFTHAQIEIRENIPASILIDCRPTELSQVILNLLSNAHHALKDAPEKWIAIEVMSDDRGVQLSVMDSGAGIATEHREKIFQPFFTTRAIGQGTGLGLSICKGIVETHGGSLTLDMASPRTRFVIRLPHPAKTAQSAA